MCGIEADESKQPSDGEPLFSPIGEAIFEQPFEPFPTVVSPIDKRQFSLPEVNCPEPDLGLYEDTGDIFLLLKYLADPEVIQKIYEADPIIVMTEQNIRECIDSCLQILAETINQIRLSKNIPTDSALRHFLLVLKKEKLLRKGKDTEETIIDKALDQVFWMERLLSEVQSFPIDCVARDLLDHFHLTADQVEFQNEPLE